MHYKKSLYFLLAFFIIGLLYTNIGFNIAYQTRLFIGYFLLIAYLVGAVSFVYRPIADDSRLKKHFFVRLAALLAVILINIVPYALLNQQHDSLGAGYLLYFTSIGLGSLLGMYMLIETIVLATRKQYDRVIINFTLAEAVYCFLLFSNLFGF